MIEHIATILKTTIEGSGLEWLDKVGGLVKTIKTTIRTPDGDDVEKTFPVACDYTNPDCDTDQRYEDFVPDSDKKSIIYFEDTGGTDFEYINSRYIQARSRLRLVCWINIPALGSTDCTLSGSFTNDLLAAVGYKLPDNSPYVNITVTFTSEEVKSAAIFNRYTYYEQTNQYLMYPFDYFALNIEVLYWYPIACNEPFTISPAVC